MIVIMCAVVISVCKERDLGQIVQGFCSKDRREIVREAACVAPLPRVGRLPSVSPLSSKCFEVGRPAGPRLKQTLGEPCWEPTNLSTKSGCEFSSVSMFCTCCMASSS